MKRTWLISVLFIFLAVMVIAGCSGGSTSGGYTPAASPTPTATVTPDPTPTSSPDPTMVSIDISPKDATRPGNDPVEYTVTGYDSQGGEHNLTSECQFSIDSGAGGTWNSNVYLPANVGTWTVKAAYSGLETTTTLEVTPAVMTRVTFANIPANHNGRIDVYRQSVGGATPVAQITVVNGEISGEVLVENGDGYAFQLIDQYGAAIMVSPQIITPGVPEWLNIATGTLEVSVMFYGPPSP